MFTPIIGKYWIQILKCLHFFSKLMETDVYSHMSKEIISPFLHVHVFHWRKTLIDNKVQVLFSKGKREHFGDFDVNNELIQT